MKLINEITKIEKKILMDKAIKKYGEDNIKKTLYDLYKWTRGDMFRINSKNMDMLKSFVTKPYPKTLYKGVRYDIFNYGDLKYTKNTFSLKDKKIAKNYLLKKLNKKIFNKYTSWTEDPKVAAKFADGECILILKPKQNDIICNVSAILNDFKFSGYAKLSSFMSNNIYVPSNEKEWILYLKPESYDRMDFWEVYFKTGYYQGDFSVDTLGLTKKNVNWHVSPV